MKNYVIVTGSCGYIGKHIAISLIAQGYNLIAVDYDVTDKSTKVLNEFKKAYNSPSDIVAIPCKLYSRSNTLKCIKQIQDMKCRIVAICHCAGRFDTIGGTFYEPLRDMFSGNIISLEHALLMAAKLRPDKFVFPNDLCSLDVENWSYYGLSKRICKNMMNNESLFNNETKFINIYFGMMIGFLPFVTKYDALDLNRELRRVQTLTEKNMPVIQTYTNKAMRDWVYPVSPFDVIGAFMYAITFDCRNDIDICIGVMNEENQLEPFNIYRLAGKILADCPVRDVVYVYRPWHEWIEKCDHDKENDQRAMEKLCYLIQQDFAKPKFKFTAFENLSEITISCVPPKLLKLPENIELSEESKAKLQDFYNRIEELLKNRTDTHGMLNLLKELYTVHPLTEKNCFCDTVHR